MTRLHRVIGLLGLIALLLSANIAFGQEATPESTPEATTEPEALDPTVQVVGSGIVVPAFDALAAASSSGATLNVAVTGTGRGFEAFCSSEADVTLAPRAINETEFIACSTNSVGFIELLLGYNVVALAANQNAVFAQCLTASELSELFAPSATGQVTNWQQLNPENRSELINLALPGSTSATYVLLDELVSGDGLRSDAVTATTAEAISLVSGAPNALAVVNFAEAEAQSAGIQFVALNTGAAGCVAPTADNADNGTYGGATPLYAYVNPNSLAKPGLTDLLNALFSAEAAEAVSAQGIVPPIESSAAENTQNIAENRQGRTFSREAAIYTIDPTVAGETTVVGAASAFSYLTGVSTAFTGIYPAATVALEISGQTVGLEAFCAGEADVLAVSSELTAEALQACTDAGITTFEIDLGSQAAVLVANANSSYLQCLTTEELLTAFSYASAGTVTTWNQVNPAFAETQMFLFTPTPGDVTTSILMDAVQTIDAPARVDEPVVQYGVDVTYRATSTSVTDGMLSLYSWQDYQDVLELGLDGLVTVGVNADGNCVTPTEETIADGTYPLARPLTLLINQASFARPEVRALAWYMAGDDQYTTISGAGFVGLPFTALDALRNRLQDAFTAAEIAAAEAAAAEATPEATAEATPDS